MPDFSPSFVSFCVFFNLSWSFKLKEYYVRIVGLGQNKDTRMQILEVTSESKITVIRMTKKERTLFVQRFKQMVWEVLTYV